MEEAIPTRNYISGCQELGCSKSLIGFPGGSDGKESACNVRDLGVILGWEDPLEEGMATHSSILDWRIPMDRGAWWTAVHAVAKSLLELRQQEADYKGALESSSEVTELFCTFILKVVT